VLTLLADALKGAVAVYILVLIASRDHAAFYIAGISAVIGHSFPVWLNFQGGKGVATALGVILMFSVPLGLSAVGIWVATLLAFHYSSLAALVAAFCIPFLGWLLGEVHFALATSSLSVLIFYRHKKNIMRLIKGTEPKINYRS
jgi:glycerol-3-phosphate acyltransferase PlsY